MLTNCDVLIQVEDGLAGGPALINLKYVTCITKQIINGVPLTCIMFENGAKMATKTLITDIITELKSNE